jgi:heme/copper-type cytochrome/quinol oxidase subunit 2
VGALSPHTLVWWAESAIGVVVAVTFAYLIVTYRRTRETVPPLSPTA